KRIPLPAVRPRRSMFRDSAPTEPLSLDTVRRVVADALRPGYFFTGPGLALAWGHTRTEEVAWEVFQGRLLDPAPTRQRRTFEAWNVHAPGGEAPPAEPLLSVKLDAVGGELHVVRGLLCHVWEGYHAGDNVYLSREATRWTRELVGTIALRRFA